MVMLRHIDDTGGNKLVAGDGPCLVEETRVDLAGKRDAEGLNAEDVQTNQGDERRVDGKGKLHVEF